MKKNIFARQRQLQAALPEPAESPYLRLYGLRDNPFPSMALFRSSTNDPRANGEIYDEEFRLNEEKEFFDRFVLPGTGDMPLPIGFIRLDPQAGGRGNGKSTFLHHLMVRLNTGNWRDWPEDPEDARLSALAIHLLPQPKQHTSFFQLIRLVFETLYQTEIGVHERKRLIRKVDGEIRAALLLDLLDEEQIDEMTERDAEEVTLDLESMDRFEIMLTGFGLDLNKLSAAAKVRLSAISSTCLDNDFIKAFLANGASIEALWAGWRTNGWAVSDHRWKRWGAEWLTNGLVPVLVMAGYQRLYVLLDEFEKIYIYQSGRKREEFLDLLRQVLYEQDSTAVRRQYITTILSIHPSIETYLKAHWARVGLDQLAPLAPGEIERISVALGSSTDERLKHLLITYLDHYRPEDDPHRGTVYPFSPGSLTPMLEKARLYPRDALRYAHAILLKASREDISAPIQKSYVEAFLSGGQAPQDDEDELDSLDPSAIDLTEE